MKSALTCCLVVIGVIVSSCSFQDRGLAPLVPQEALGFVQITDPDTFIKNADAFMGPMGLTAMTNNMGARDLLALGLKTAAALDLSALDLKKPIGLAILPPKSESADFGYILYLPLVKPDESGPKLLKLLDVNGNVVFSTANGYGIFSQAVSSVSYPPAKSMQIPASLIFVPGTMTIYGDIQSMLSHYKLEWSKLKSEALSELSSLESGDAGDQALTGSANAINSSMADGIFAAIEQTQSLALQISADGKGLTIQDTVEFSKDGSVVALFKAIGPGQGLASMAKYLPANFLMTGVASGNPAAFKDLYQAWTGSLFDTLKLPEAEKAAIAKLMEQSFMLAGKNVSWGIDLKLDPALMTMQQEEVIGNLDRSVNFDLVLVQDVPDPAAYQKYLKDNMTGASLKKYLDASLSETGFTLDITYEEKKDGDFNYQEMKFSVAVGDAEKLSMTSDEARTAASVVAGVMDKITMTMAFKGNKLYTVMGADSLASLKKLLAGDQTEKPITTNLVWSNWIKTAPGDAQYVGNLSVARIAGLAKIFTGNAVSLDIPENDQSGINSWIRIKDTSFTSSLSWDIKEMSPLVKTGIQLGTSLFAQNAFTDNSGEPYYDEGDSPSSNDDDYDYGDEEMGD